MIRSRLKCALLLPALAAAGFIAGQDASGQGNGAAGAAPAGTQVKNATGGALQDRSARSPEEALYVAKCGMCHRQMGMGTVIIARRTGPATAMLEKRDDLTRDYIVQAARTGVGNMPRVQRGEVSDAELAIIARYLSKGTK